MSWNDPCMECGEPRYACMCTLESIKEKRMKMDKTKGSLICSCGKDVKECTCQTECSPFYKPEKPKPKAVKAHGMRYNDGKLKYSYVHWQSLEPMVRVLMFGAQKYEPFNWQKGLKKDEILESAMRHLTKMIDGEVNDPESGLPHVGHLMCNAMFYQYMVIKELQAEKKRL